MLGTLAEGRLLLEEVHRFENEPVKMLSTLYWDFPRLFREVLHGIRKGAKAAGGRLDGIGVDSWGVDFGLLDAAGDLLSLPVHYRDRRTEGMMEEVFERLPRETIFAETGIQFLPLNTLYQIAALSKRNPEALAHARKLLLIADLVSYLLTGRAASERTLASTTQLWNPVARCWSTAITGAVGIPRRVLPEVIEPGTVVGPLRSDLSAACGVREPPPVIATASHDTAAAIAAVPALDDVPWAYLSSGTWSLLGIELDAPEISPGAMAKNFTNEGGACGKTTFLRNIAGLWLMRECRRVWTDDGEPPGYEELTRLAREAGPAAACILPNHHSFFAPADMPAAIRSFCTRTAQPPPESRGAILRCALESLALAYREVADQAAELSGRPIARLHVVGGGTRNELLNQLTADALGIPVVAGPVEATAMGNILVQALAAGEIASLAELRSIAHRSAATRAYAPRHSAEWETKYRSYRDLAARA
jgi:rhamnulokinase